MSCRNLEDLTNFTETFYVLAGILYINLLFQKLAYSYFVHSQAFVYLLA
jgi:hypothetical protein